MAPIPRMTNVFSEASLHAWKNLGLDQEVKTWLEASFKPDMAYLLAICYMPWVKDEMELLKDFGSESRVEAFRKAWDNDPHAIYQVLQALHKNSDPKLPGILKSDAHRIAKMATAQAEEYFNDLNNRINIPTPAGYHDTGSAFCKSLNGWSWHNVSEQECKDHEGALMQHCGANDMGDIYSLRDPNGKPHITVEMDLTDSPWTVYQFKGKQNKAPAKKLWPYAVDFLEQLFEQNGQALWTESYEGGEGDPEGFLDMVIGTKLIEFMTPKDFQRRYDPEAAEEDERAFMGDMNPDPDCPDCLGNVPPGRTCQACGGFGARD